MKKELQEKLFEKYPKIFAQRHLPKTESAMCYGIGCGDGWYDLIDTLCMNIQTYTDFNNKKVAKKSNNWGATMIPPNYNRIKCEAKQVKSKFGGLRFYIAGGDNFIEGLIKMTESMSRKINEKIEENNDTQSI